jgi:integrase
LRSELARGHWDVLEPKPAPTLAEFLRKDFLPFTESKCAEKPATVRYYAAGGKSLLSSDLAGMVINEITDQHAGQYAARHSHLSPSTVNCGLRTLRRALYLAAEWGKLNRKPKITLAKGERQRDRVLTDAEVGLYLGACEQPWRDCATIMLGTGIRPAEVFALSWQRVQLNGHSGLLQITEGKSKAARRMLPLVHAVYQALKARWTSAGSPEEGWVFPADTTSGHIEGGSAKNYHARALDSIRKDAEAKQIENRLKPFPPYTMRHTALTRLADAGCDAFTLARIAGHSSITITQRYCHPQADAIERAFAKLTDGGVVVTEGGQRDNCSDTAPKTLTAGK